MDRTRQVAIVGALSLLLVQIGACCVMVAANVWRGALPGDVLELGSALLLTGALAFWVGRRAWTVWPLLLALLLAPLAVFWTGYTIGWYGSWNDWYGAWASSGLHNEVLRGLLRALGAVFPYVWGRDLYKRARLTRT